MKLLIFLLTLVACEHTVRFPSSFKSCDRSQPNLHQCTKEAAEFNIHQLIHPFKDLRLPGLKPLSIPTLNIGSGTGAVAVDQHFWNCHLYGLDHVEFEKFEFDFDRKTLSADLHISEVTKKCNYQLNGKVLLLPIVGDGDSTIVLNNVKLIGSLKYEEVKRNGKTYPKFNSYGLTLDVSHVYFHFDNLFNGDKQLGDTINKVLNDNWKEVFDDVKSGYTQAINEIIRSLLNNFWGRVSLEDAFDPPK